MGSEVPPPREDWQDEAACKGVGTTWFYADVLRGRPPKRRPRITEDGKVEFYGDMQWRTMCPGCPVRPECLAHAILHRERWGVWGGLTPAARRNIEEFLQAGTVAWPQIVRMWGDPQR